MEQYIRACRGDFSFDPDIIKLFAFRRCKGDKWRSKKLEFEEVPRKERYALLEPFLVIERHEAQKLIDDLWDCGLRPSEGSGSAGALKKTENHLSDMRKIAFHKLGINEKEERQV